MNKNDTTENSEEPKKEAFEISTPQDESSPYGKNKEELYGNGHLVYVLVQINGTSYFDYTYLKLEISQRMNGLHEFILTAGLDEFEESHAYLFQNSRECLGKRITFQFRQFGETTSMFTGIITRISTPKKNGVRELLIQGTSPDILMQNGSHCRSFENKTFKEIIREVAQPYPQSLVNFHVNPNYQERLDYIVQYNCSDLQFLQQLSTRFGEYFYYNGEQFCFSAWGGEIIEIMEEEDVYEYELSMALQPQHFSYTAYDAKQGTSYTLDSKSEPGQRSKNPFQQHAYNVSQDIYNVIPTAHYDESLLLSGKMEMKHLLESEKGKNQNVVYLRATSNNPNLRLGDVVKMSVWIPGHKIFKNGKVPIESYKIIEIIHHFGDGDGYTNSFVAVPKDLPVPPYSNRWDTPRADVQHATVTDNQDPLQMGRVRVQFVWQQPSNSQTPWIQVIQPHAGGGKGTYFNPEIGETVLCAFQGGNAEAPIVLGTAYNGGEIAAYYTEGNDLKVIQSRSGTRIVFNDAEGSILIEDPSGNSAFLDGKGNIKVHAPKDLSVTVGDNMDISVGKNLTIDVGENIAETAGNDIYQSAEGKISETSEMRTEMVEGSYQRESSLSQEISEQATITSNVENMLLQSGKTVQVNSAEKSDLF